MFLFKKKFQSKHIENKPLISNNITTNQKSNTSKELLSFNVSQIESIPLRIKKEGFKFIRIYYIVYFNINENDNSKSDILILKSLKKKKSEALKKYL